ncbi:CRISPR-associated endonuclease Cas1 [Endozoicomonas sp. ONNA2]|uniref:CRISPR-associated endonuclease Cas1 n=1 Tax=Endozoicomonas sp. ONNA2 TaxID=2828741 RepID=UPI002148E48B|nr:CRISPR-associated endonuclease Cas1 [Endozoicomonas sp. ONNA2]
MSEPAGDVIRRMGQYRGVSEEALATRMARALVRSKLRQQWLWLCQQGLRESAIAVKQLMGKIGAAKRPALLGLEGSAARTVYQAMASLLPDEWRFSGRNRRPPGDPVNAMLSFGSTLIYQQAVQALTRQRLDVFAGFYHQPCAGRASLAWDMVELFRPTLEAFIIEQLRKGHILQSHFTTPAPDGPVSEGCRFTSEGLGAWFHYWLALSRIAERRMEKLSLKWAQAALQYKMG